MEIIHNPKTPEPIDDRSVTLYDITAAANLKTLFTNKQQYALGKIWIPNISVCDGAVYVNGDSMYPILKSGDIIGYKEISSFDNVIYGEIYLVSFMIDGDEYLAVKYVNRSEQEGHLKLVSYNTHHEPMDIPFASINAMAIVKFLHQETHDDVSFTTEDAEDTEEDKGKLRSGQTAGSSYRSNYWIYDPLTDL